MSCTYYLDQLFWIVLCGLDRRCQETVKEKCPVVKGVRPIVLHVNLVVWRQSRYAIGQLPSVKGSKSRLVTSWVWMFYMNRGETKRNETKRNETNSTLHFPSFTDPPPNPPGPNPPPSPSTSTALDVLQRGRSKGPLPSAHRLGSVLPRAGHRAP